MFIYILSHIRLTMSSDAAVIPDSVPVAAPEAPIEEEGEDFTAPDFEECENCPLYHDQLRTAGEQVAELKGQLNDSEEEVRSLTSNVAVLGRSFNQFKKEHNFFTHRTHELNKLRAAVDSLANLGVPVNDLLAPENVELLLQMEPSADPKPFNNPLARHPSGAWKKMRALTPLDSTEATTLLSAQGDYFITRDFTEYRQAFAKYLTDHRSFRCNNCNCNMHAKFNWCLCMRCLAVPYCGRICLQQGQAFHSIGCQQHHVWSIGIPYRAPYVPDVPEEPTSSSSSSFSYSSSSSTSSATGGGDKKRKRDSRVHDNSKKPCRFYTDKGVCNPKDPSKPCDFKHCNETRKAYLLEEASKLPQTQRTRARHCS